MKLLQTIQYSLVFVVFFKIVLNQFFHNFYKIQSIFKARVFYHQLSIESKAVVIVHIVRVFDLCICFLFVRAYFNLCVCFFICACVFQFVRVFALLGHRIKSLCREDNQTKPRMLCLC